MADSTLDPDNDPVPDRQLGKGHDTRALGPSDLSDSGSDMVGGTGLAGEEDLLDDRIVAEDTERNTEPGYTDAGAGAGADIGDTDLDADSDSGGTGERAAASRDTSQPLGQDIGVDRTVDASEAGLGGGLDEAELAQRKPDRPSRDR